jgi:hypothetical protein
VGMCHKAFAFDWHGFEQDQLHDLLAQALETNDTAALKAYIETNRHFLKDPCEGEPLDNNWLTMLENRDVHEFGDFALTRFYDPTDDFGIWDQWKDVDEILPDNAKAATLGVSFCRNGNHFDPGRLGSYFQTPDQVRDTFALLAQFELPLDDYQQKSFARFKEGLKDCISSNLGLYVTF